MVDGGPTDQAVAPPRHGPRDADPQANLAREHVELGAGGA